jgi:hypothetical protein
MLTWLEDTCRRVARAVDEIQEKRSMLSLSPGSVCTKRKTNRTVQRQSCPLKSRTTMGAKRP